jgi:predicted phage-related endonuclease
MKLRKTGLTATDMVKLSGENPYGSAITVYEEKTAPDPTPPEPGDKPVVVPMDQRALTGQALEAGIAKRYAMDAPEGKEIRVVQTNLTYRHPSVKWALATPDRFIFEVPTGDRVSRASLLQRLKNGQKADRLLETKLVGTRLSKHWNLSETQDEPDCDRIPPYVMVQVQWQMFVCEYEIVDVGAVLYGTTYKSFRIRQDKDFTEALYVIGEEFWRNHVLARVPPPCDGSDAYSKYLANYYPEVYTPMIPAPEGSLEFAKAYQEASERERIAKEDKARAGQALKSIIREAAGLTAPWGKVLWNARTDGTRVLKVNVTKEEDEVF